MTPSSSSRTIAWRRASALGLAALLLAPAGCKSTGDADDPQAANPDEAAHEALLRRQEKDAAEVEAQLGLVDGAALTDSVRDLVAALTRPRPRPEGLPAPTTGPVLEPPPTVKILDDSVANVFTLPGRRVYLTRGLLAWLDDDASTALVIAHALGHDGHKTERPDRDERWSAGLGLADPLLEGFAKVAGLPGHGLARLARGHTIGDEREADERAVDRVARAGFDPGIGLQLFDRLDALPGGEALPTWPSTHPAPSRPTSALLTRARRVQAEAGVPAADADAVRRAREATMHRLEGLTYGPDPRRGHPDSGWLVHPTGRFRLPLPGRWRVRTTTTEVQLAAPDGAAIVVVDSGLDEHDAGVAADHFGEREGIDVDVDRELEVDGHRAVRLVSRATSTDGPIVILSTFVELDGHVVALHGVSTKETWEDRRPQLIAMHDGFQRYTDPIVLDVAPATLHVIEVERDAPLREVLTAWPIPERVDLDLAGLAALNGRKLEETVPAGTLLKVIKRGR